MKAFAVIARHGAARRAQRRPDRARLVCWLTAVVITCGMAGSAHAHARLVRSEPAAEAELGSAPTIIALWFNERPEADFSSVRVLDTAGSVVMEGALVRSREANGLEFAVPQVLPAGSYTVRYRVLSVDGHVIEGSFSFRVESAAAEP